MLELNKIYCMDCLEGLKLIPDNSIDLVLTDPPYGTNDGKGKIVKIGNEYKNFCDEVGEWDKELLIHYIQELPRIMKDDTWGVIFTDKMAISIIWEEIQKTGMVPRNTYHIIKTDKPPVPRCNFISSVETAIIFTKGRTTVKWRGGSNGDNGSITRNYEIVNQLAVTETRLHPTQKHITTMRRLIQLFTDENDTVLDPFMGSGTTAVACKQLRRNFIGFELSQKYVDIANKRLSQETIFDYVLEGALCQQ